MGCSAKKEPFVSCNCLRRKTVQATFSGTGVQNNKMSEYDNVQKSSLKLKGVSDHGVKKKKKKKKNKEKEEILGSSIKDSSSVSAKIDKRTPAEIAFERSQEKRKAEELLEKAGKTHKERITEFNKHLDNLSEHFDIPKVSWTK